MKKIVLLILAAVVAVGHAECPLSFPGVDAATVGVYIAPIGHAEGKTIEYQADKLLLPASTLKAVTVAAAMKMYPPSYRWATSMLYSGQLDSDGTFHGDLLIKGSGDPTLGSRHFPGQPDFIAQLDSALTATGIRKIDGSISLAPAYPDQGAVTSWELEDLDTTDGAGFFRLNWGDNLSGKRPMANPAEALLQQLNAKYGTAPRTLVVAPTDVLFTHLSPSLAEVSRSLMHRSDNMFAEATLRLLTPAEPRKAALTTERSLLPQLASAKIADGSGLSRHDAISPRQMAAVLTAMASNTDYLSTFARVGSEGTVRSFMKGVPGRQNFILKSGSMTGVVCYCGYRLDPETRTPTHVIVVMVNQTYSPTETRQSIARLLSEIK